MNEGKRGKNMARKVLGSYLINKGVEKVIIRKVGTRKIIAVLAIVALLASYTIALAQDDDSDEFNPEGQQQEEQQNLGGEDEGISEEGGDGFDEDELDEDELDEDELDEDELDEDKLDAGDPDGGTEGIGAGDGGEDEKGTDGKGDNGEGDDFGGISLFSSPDPEPLASGITYELEIYKAGDIYWAKFDNITGDFKSGVQYFEWNPDEVKEGIDYLQHLVDWGECPLEINAKGGNPKNGGYDETKTLSCITKSVTIAGFVFKLVDYNGEEDTWKFKVTGPGEESQHKGLSHFSFSYIGGPEEPPDEPEGKIKVIKTVKGVGSLSGFTFNLYKDGVEEPYASLTTEESGIIEFTKLGYGTYRLEEAEDEDYQNNLDEEETYVIDAENLEHTVNVINTAVEEEPPEPDKGKIKVIKTMSDNESPEGITFNLDRYEPQFKPVSLTLNGDDSWPKTGVTDKDGEIVFDNLEPGEYTLTEHVPDGYQTDLDPEQKIVVEAGAITTVEVLNTRDNDDEPTGSITVVKTLDRLEGTPHANVQFKLYRHQIASAYALALDEDGELVHTDKTDVNGKIIFTDLDCEGYYYILEEIDMEGYEVTYYVDTDEGLSEADECPDIFVDCGEETTVHVVNTKINDDDDDPNGDDDDDDDDDNGGGGGGGRRRPTPESIEVPEEPEVFTPPVEEPVVVEEPLITAPVLPDLPHTGGNPAAFVFLGAALAGLGLYVRKRR